MNYKKYIWGWVEDDGRIWPVGKSNDIKSVQTPPVDIYPLKYKLFRMEEVNQMDIDISKIGEKWKS